MRFHWNGFFYKLSDNDVPYRWKTKRDKHGWLVRTGEAERVSCFEYATAYDEYLAYEKSINEAIKSGEAIAH